MVPVKPVSRSECDEELGSIGVGARVGHGQLSALRVLDLQVLVGELCAIDRDTTGAVTSGEVTSLGHETSDNPVEVTLLIGQTLGVIGGTKGTEVLCCLRAFVFVELEMF